MKTSTQPFQPESQNQGVDTQLDAQEPGKNLIDFCLDPSQRKSLLRIEVTSIWRYHSDGTADKTSQKRVFYRKPLSTHRGKIDMERLALEILSRR